jgi:hypothetical protein
MKSEDTTTQTGKIIQINEARVREHLAEICADPSRRR